MNSVYDKMRGGTVPMLDMRERSMIEKIVAKEGLKFAFIVWIIVRLVLSGWGVIITEIAPESSHTKLYKDYPGLTLPSRNFEGLTLEVWNIYDARHYITIANSGYSSDPGYLTAFYPGFPLMIKAVSVVLDGHALLAAVLIANLSALIFFWYLYRLVDADYGEKVARRAVILSAVFPTAFYLFMPYTEGPLLAFAVASLYYGRQQKWMLAGALAGCAALIKQPGVFLILPLGYMYWRQFVTYKKSSAFLRKLDWAWLLLCPIAAALYNVYRYLNIDIPLAQPTDLGAGESIVLPGQPLWNAFLAMRFDNPVLAANILDTAFTLLMIALVIFTVVKIRSTTYSLFSIVIAIVSLCVTWPYDSRPEVDMPRRLLIIFPIFILLALMTEKQRIFRYVVMASSALYLVLSGLFINWVFVS